MDKESDKVEKEIKESDKVEKESKESDKVEKESDYFDYNKIDENCDCPNCKIKGRVKYYE